MTPLAQAVVYDYGNHFYYFVVTKEVSGSERMLNDEKTLGVRLCIADTVCLPLR